MTEVQTPPQIMEALKSICAEVGPKAEAHASVSHNGLAGGSLHPDGILGTPRLYVHGHTEWSGVVEALRGKWEEYRDLHAANTIKGMAMAIIRLTAECGECTDGALRCEFTQQEIDRHGEAAADLATEMGANGPFKIVRVASNMEQAA